MRKVLVLALAVLLLGAAPTWAASNQAQAQNNANNRGYGYGYQGMGPGMMGPGYGYQGMGPGMMGPGYGGSYGMGPGPQGWQNMSPLDRQKWQRMQAKFLRDTLALRQELYTKQMELQTLWQQDNPDHKRINELSDQVADLRAKLDKQRNRFLSQCRQQFGNRGWSCPGMGW